jgi:hypothetical protein
VLHETAAITEAKIIAVTVERTAAKEMIFDDLGLPYAPRKKSIQC